jgi:hypothetical protein
MSTEDDHAARAADQAAYDAANPPAPRPEPPTPIYDGVPSMFASNDLSVTEADIQRALDGERHDIAIMLASNDPVTKFKGQERQDAFKNRASELRTQYGVAAPVIDPERDALAEIGRVKDAKPSDYRAPDFNSAAWIEGDARVRVSNACVELATVHKLNQQAYTWVTGDILEGSAAIRGMDAEQRATYWAEQDKIIEHMSGGYIAAKERLQVAREFLGKTQFGHEAMPALLHNAGLVMTIWNLHQAEKGYCASRK